MGRSELITWNPKFGSQRVSQQCPSNGITVFEPSHTWQALAQAGLSDNSPCGFSCTLEGFSLLESPLSPN